MTFQTTHLPDRHRDFAWKVPVRAASTANGTLATAYENGDTLDGVVLATGDRILLKDQTAGAENGIYKVNVSGAPTRTADFDTQADILGAVVVVTNGTANADTMWLCSTNAPITVDTTALVFGAVAGGSGAPTTADYLVGTAQGGLSAEIVVGATPGGELGNTWASPTVDATHAGSTHSAATDTHIADAVDAHDASAVSIVDAGSYFAGTEVEAALQELGAGSGGGGIGPILIADDHSTPLVFADLLQTEEGDDLLYSDI